MMLSFAEQKAQFTPIETAAHETIREIIWLLLPRSEMDDPAKDQGADDTAVAVIEALRMRDFRIVTEKVFVERGNERSVS